MVAVVFFNPRLSHHNTPGVAARRLNPFASNRRYATQPKRVRPRYRGLKPTATIGRRSATRQMPDITQRTFHQIAGTWILRDRYYYRYYRDRFPYVLSSPKWHLSISNVIIHTHHENISPYPTRFDPIHPHRNPILLMNFQSWIRHATILFLACLILPSTVAQTLTTWKQCTLIPTDWADGDSFQIQTPQGQRHTIRLYGADCIEWHVKDETDARRLRAQRRYFGISEWGGSPLTSIQAAKDLGQAAAKEVASTLKRPFQVHTAFADAGGDARYKRIYAFVTTADGEDLAERLVRLGLARAFGVYRETPSGKSANDYRAFLQDIELQAAKRGAGAWAKTNWDRLPSEREAERRDSGELAKSVGTPKLPTGTKINPNTATLEQLKRLPGIGDVTAKRIIQGRPYRTPEDLLKVQGIGPKTLTQLKPFLHLP